MDEQGRSPGQSEPFRPKFRDPSAGWRWWGILLIVLGSAGLMFHQVWDIPYMHTWEGRIALAAFVGGALLVIVSWLRRGRA